MRRLPHLPLHPHARDKILGIRMGPFFQTTLRQIICKYPGTRIIVLMSIEPPPGDSYSVLLSLRTPLQMHTLQWSPNNYIRVSYRRSFSYRPTKVGQN